MEGALLLLREYPPDLPAHTGRCRELTVSWAGARATSSRRLSRGSAYKTVIVQCKPCRLNWVKVGEYEADEAAHDHLA
jgi:hypothetical protein